MLSLQDIKKYAMRYSREGMLPSVFAAQSILETNVLNGGSELARKYNNYFGIQKGSTWIGDTVTMKTKEEYSGIPVYEDKEFRVYKSPEDSFKDRVNLLLSLNRYQAAYSETTPEAQAYALQRGGYATDSRYAEKLINIIDTYNLRKLDKTKKTMKNVQIGILTLSALIVIGMVYIIVKG